MKSRKEKQKSKEILQYTFLKIVYCVDATHFITCYAKKYYLWSYYTFYYLQY